jgi:hypothetical protein
MLPTDNYTYYAVAIDDAGVKSPVASVTDLLRTEIVSDVATTVQASAGQALSLPIRYTTSTGDTTLMGLGLRIHFDSSLLNYTGVSEVLSRGLFVDAIVCDDVDDFDRDASTDQYVFLAWADGTRQWPNQSLPAQLCVAEFTVVEDLGTKAETSINFSSSSEDAAYGYDSRPITVRFNDLPTISDVLDQVGNEDSSLGPISFTIGDTETAASELTVSGSSSNQALLPDANIVFAGSGADRTLTVIPAANRYGTAIVTLTVADDSGGTASDSFLLTVPSVNDPPVIAQLSDGPDPVVAGREIVLSATGVCDELDPQGEVLRVEFYRESNGNAGLQTGDGGDIYLASDSESGDGWSAIVSTAGLELGTYTYYASAVDDEGAESAVVMTANTVQAPPNCQIVSDTSATLKGVAGQSISVPVRYTTSTGDTTLSGLGLRVHYDSSVLIYNGLDNVLASSLIGQQPPANDSEDWDNDPSTDKYLLAWWLDISGNWPGVTLPAELFDANFVLADDAPEGTATCIRFSATSNAPTYSFESRPVTVQIIGKTPVPPTLDADGNGVADALTDGILILRYLFDPNGAWEVCGTLGAGATRTTRDAVKSFLDGGRESVLDVDGNGAADALTDGILILRYLFAQNGPWEFADALGSYAARTCRADVKNFLDQYLPGANASATTLTEEAVPHDSPTVLTTPDVAVPADNPATADSEGGVAVAPQPGSVALATLTAADESAWEDFSVETPERELVADSNVVRLDAPLRRWEPGWKAPASSERSIRPDLSTESATEAAIDRLCRDGGLGWWLRNLDDDAFPAFGE